MFAAHCDQENLVHAHQSNAAFKPMNQGVRALHPKTPGLKTPFRANKHDENQPITKKDGKTNGLVGHGKLDKSIQATPAPKTVRAPLGAKATNIKAQAFQTPAPAQNTIKKLVNKPSTARRSARKIHVAQTEPVQANLLHDKVEEEEPDYNTPRPYIQDLPDPPIEFGYDQSFPQFQPENMFRDYGEIFLSSPKDENGMSLRLKKEEEDYQRLIDQRTRDYNDSLDQLRNSTMSDSEEEAMLRGIPYSKKSKPHIQESTVDTLRAKAAASALSGPRPHMTFPSAALKPTMSSLQKQKQAVPGTRKPLSVSKNTIGFPPARRSRSILPPLTRLEQNDSEDEDLVDSIADLNIETIDDGYFQLDMPED